MTINSSGRKAGREKVMWSGSVRAASRLTGSRLSWRAASRGATLQCKGHAVVLPKSFTMYRKFSTTEGKVEETTANASTATADASGSSTEAEKPAVVDDKEIISKLQKEVKELKDQVIRSYAEEENVRRIAKRDVENAKAYANEKFAKSMLDVADNLERALQAIPTDKKDEKEDPVLNNLAQGIVLTEKNLQKIFLQHNIVKYGTIGDAFNPDLHDALFNIPDPNKTPNTIGQILKSGYKLKDRTLRAAQVGCYVAPPTENPN